MEELEFDSSNMDYIENTAPENYKKKLDWEMAIGLQKVDNLEPSKYLQKIMKDNISGEKTIYEVECELKRYYIELDKTNKVVQSEFECDLVSTRMVHLINNDDFELSSDYIKNIHEYLFKDIYEFAGVFRNVDFSKQERILNNARVAYGDHLSLLESLEYDISLEKNKNYNEMNIVEVINNITDFSSNIWQIHPFREGNTRTTA